MISATILRPLCVVGAALFLSAVSLAATFEYQAKEGTYPDAQGWTDHPGNGTETLIPNYALRITDTSGASPGFWYNNSSGLGSLSSTAQWEARASVRLDSYSTVSTERGGFNLFVGDGTNAVNVGITLVGGVQRFNFTDSVGGLHASPYTTSQTGFVDLLVRKTGTTGGAGDTVELYVDGVLAKSGSYTSGLVSFAFGSKDLEWGPFSSPPLAVVDVVGVTFGINEAAPSIPEPGSALVLAIAGAMAWPLKRPSRRPSV